MTINTQQRDATIDKLASAYGPWVFKVISYIRRMSPGRVFTTDEVWTWLRQGGKPDPAEPRAMGAAIMNASREGLIEHQGYRISRRSVCHNRPVSIWRRA